MKRSVFLPIVDKHKFENVICTFILGDTIIYITVNVHKKPVLRSTIITPFDKPIILSIIYRYQWRHFILGFDDKCVNYISSIVLTEAFARISDLPKMGLHALLVVGID